MTNTVSFITANFVARQIGYHMTEGWMQGDNATNAYFKPLETFPERFGAMLGEIRALGFTALDLWAAHLNPAWATEAHLAAAKALLAEHGLSVTSLAAWNANLEALEGNARLAQALGAPFIAGGAPLLRDHRAESVGILKRYGVRLGFENHPEKTPQEVLELIEGGDGYLGTALDTGWWATQGYSPARAIRDLKDHLFTVHLKDIKAAGAHETCALGQGVAEIAACVEALREVDYRGVIGIEHEPERHDPSEDVRASKAALEGWMRGAVAR